MQARSKEYLPYISQKDGCILTDSNQGPEAAWGTGRAVVGTPYHSNAHGIIDSYTFLNTTDPISLISLIKKRNIQTSLELNPIYILSKKIKREKPSKNTVYTYVPNRTIFNQIVAGEINFCFLHPAPDMPEEIKQKYIIFHVDFTACENQKTQAP